jgi:PAS domain S-box-containing protein
MGTADRPGDVASGIDGVLITAELARRPSRPSDHAAESRAFAELAQAMAADPDGVLRKLAELVLDLCHAQSAGVSVLEPDGAGGAVFAWRAVAGAFAANLGGTIPRDASPCGAVVERDEVLLFDRAERFFPGLRGVEPPIFEALLAPWHAAGGPAGTLWAIAHDPARHFDAEDARLLASLARFAALAHRTAGLLAGLRESEERYRALVETSPKGVLVHRDGVVIFANPRAAELFGAAGPEDLLGRDVLGELVAPDSRPLARARTERLREPGASVGFTGLTYRKLDGTPFPVEAGAAAVPFGGRLAVQVAFRDVSERERAATEARRLDLSREAILTWELGGAIVYWNTGAEELYGFPRAEAHGRVSHELLGTVHPTGLAAFEAALAEAGHWVGELVHTTRGGREVVVESRQEVLREPDGRLLVLETNRDVTGRRRQEAELREREARLRSILETVPDAIVTIDERGLIGSFSPAAEALFGYRAEEALGRNVSLLMPEGRGRSSRRAWRGRSAAGPPRERRRAAAAPPGRRPPPPPGSRDRRGAAGRGGAPAGRPPPPARSRRVRPGRDRPRFGARSSSPFPSSRRAVAPALSEKGTRAGRVPRRGSSPSSAPDHVRRRGNRRGAVAGGTGWPSGRPAASGTA